MKERVQQFLNVLKRWRQRLKKVDYGRIARLLGTLIKAVAGVRTRNTIRPNDRADYSYKLLHSAQRLLNTGRVDKLLEVNT